MKAVSGKRLCELLEGRGWRLMRIRGSHHVYAKAGTAIRISVPVHGNVPLKIGLQRQIMKLADIAESEL